MNADMLEGQWKQLKGDAKIWWGKTIADPATEIEGHWDKLKGSLQEQKGATQEAIDEEVAKFKEARERFSQKMKEEKDEIVAKWNKLTHKDVDDTQGSMEALSGKIQEAYGVGEEDANAQVKSYLSEF